MSLKDTVTYLQTEGILQEMDTRTHCKTTFTEGVSESPPLFSSVYSLRGKTTPSMKIMHWPPSLTPGSVPCGPQVCQWEAHVYMIW